MPDLSIYKDESLHELYEGFVGRINNILYKYPSLQLDGTWPSLSTIDLLTFPYRQRVALIAEEEADLHHIAIYIATFISKIWKSCEYNPVISLNTNSEICIHASLEGKIIVLEVEEICKKVLQEFENTLPVFDDFYRPCSYDTNIVSGLVLGLVTALSPLFKDSPFRLYEEEKQALIKQKIEKLLAIDISNWFTRVHPDNPFVQIPEMYLKGFIFPPFLMEQSQPFVHAVRSLNDYLTQMKFPKSMYKSLGDMFASCIDEQVSLIGISLLGNFSRIEEASKASLAAAKSRRYATPLLREAIVELRKKNFSCAEWIGHVPQSNEEYHACKHLFQLDVDSGTLPWLSISYDKITKTSKTEQLFELVNKCKEFYFSDAEKMVNKIVEEEPFDLEMRIQQIKLLQVKGDFEQAEVFCKKLISEPGADAYPEFFNMWGACLLELSEPELAARYFRAARSVKNIQTSLMADVLNNLAWSNIQLGLIKEAKESLHEAEKLSMFPLTIYLNLAYVYALENDYEARYKYLGYAVKLAPYDRRVFANLI